jgi:hypothetical protein
MVNLFFIVFVSFGYLFFLPYFFLGGGGVWIIFLVVYPMTCTYTLCTKVMNIKLAWRWLNTAETCCRLHLSEINVLVLFNEVYLLIGKYYVSPIRTQHLSISVHTYTWIQVTTCYLHRIRNLPCHTRINSLIQIVSYVSSTQWTSCGSRCWWNDCTNCTSSLSRKTCNCDSEHSGTAVTRWQITLDHSTKKLTGEVCAVTLVQPARAVNVVIYTVLDTHRYKGV